MRISHSRASTNQNVVNASKPPPSTICGANELVLILQTEQTKASSPNGPKKFTPNMNQLSQSCASGLPEQSPDSGHIATAKHAIAMIISAEAKTFCCTEA